MSIGRRIFDFARSELNSLLDKAARTDDRDDSGGAGGDPDEDLYRRYSLDQLTDAELEAELDRRRQHREAAARAARSAPRPGPSAGPRPGPRPSTSTPPPRAADDELRKAYAALEVPFGADFDAVRKAYRGMMRRYHPDRHTQSPEKQKAANELAQKLTDAYKKLEKHLRR